MIELQFLILKILHDEIQRGSQNRIWKECTIAQRQAIEREYKRKLQKILQTIENDDTYNNRWPTDPTDVVV